MRFLTPHPSCVLLAFASVTLFRSVAASFNLNTSGPDWDYTAKELTDTTSQACRDAYSATIDCDSTLLGLVASMRPAFRPASSDLDNTCTDSCKSSLAAYIANVTAACSAAGDKAKESLGARGGFIYDAVQLVGQIFQYTYAADCRKDRYDRWRY